MTKKAEATVEIDAPIERVWQVMTDVARYSEWNPFIVSVGHNGPQVLDEARHTTCDQFRGPLAFAIPLKKVQAGFEAQALKRRAESL